MVGLMRVIRCISWFTKRLGGALYARRAMRQELPQIHQAGN